MDEGSGRRMGDGEFLGAIVVGVLCLATIVANERGRVRWDFYWSIRRSVVEGLASATDVTADLRKAQGRDRSPFLRWVESPLAGTIGEALEGGSLWRQIKTRLTLRLYRNMVGAVLVGIAFVSVVGFRRRGDVARRLREWFQDEPEHRRSLVLELEDLDYGTDYRMHWEDARPPKAWELLSLLGGLQSSPDLEKVGGRVAALIWSRRKVRYRAGEGQDVGPFGEIVTEIVSRGCGLLRARYGTDPLPRSRQMSLLAMLCQDLGKLHAFFSADTGLQFVGPDHEVKSVNILLTCKAFRDLPEKDRSVVCALILSHHTRGLPDSLWKEYHEDLRIMQKAEARVIEAHLNRAGVAA